MVMNRVIMKQRCVLQRVTRPLFSRRLKNKSSEDGVKYTPEEHVEYDILERIRKVSRTAELMVTIGLVTRPHVLMVLA